MNEVAPIPEEVVGFLQNGLSIVVGTRDATLKPCVLRGIAAFVAPDRRSLAVHVPRAVAARTLANLRDNGRVAATFSRIADHRSLQVKGRCVEIRDASDEERGLQEEFLAAFAANLETIGMQGGRVGRLTYWPSVAIHIAVDAIFDQTPGPKAGSRLEGGA